MFKDGTNKEGKVIQMSTWTFITNHARVMMVITQDPTVRLRDIASSLDITERAAQRIVTELVDEGYLSRKREGRRNTYTVHPNKPLRAAQASDTEIGEFIDLLLDNQKQKPLALAS
jgi:predicted transcriptional regulator